MADNEHERDLPQELEDDGAPVEPEVAEQREEEPEAEEAGTQALAGALKASFAVLKVVMAALVVFVILKGFFQVKANEVRFKLRGGAVVKSHDSYAIRSGAIRYVAPWEKLETVSTAEKTLALDTEYWTLWPPPGSQQGPGKQSLDVREDGFLLTGDANIVHMRLRVRYRPSSDTAGALAYKFAIKDAEAILRREVMASTTKVVGSLKVMDILQRKGLRGMALFETITADVQQRLKAFEQKAGVPLGLDVVAVEAIESGRYKNPTYPQPVSDAFIAAQNAGIDANQSLEAGRSEAGGIEADAYARDAEVRARGRSDAAKMVQDAEAAAKALSELLPVYRSSPEEARTLRESIYHRLMRTVARRGRITNVVPGDIGQVRVSWGGSAPPKKTGDDSAPGR